MNAECECLPTSESGSLLWICEAIVHHAAGSFPSSTLATHNLSATLGLDDRNSAFLVNLQLPIHHSEFVIHNS
jgi:hypothetical protein